MIIKHAESYRSQPIPQGLLDAMGEFVAVRVASLADNITEAWRCQAPKDLNAPGHRA